jgi:peptidoglycan/LPS O-acetylase OafA/YrhL
MDQGIRMSNTAPANKINGFGALRLLFAGLVILSHSPEMMTGDRSRELLTSLFGTMSFGDLAVDCFFLISGYLITGSMLRNSQGYLWRRVLRIYPAFVICTGSCLFLVAPLGGGNLAALSAQSWEKLAVHMLLLQSPRIDSVFPGTHYPALNGSMWTIAYEFRCYLLSYLLGRLSLLKSRRFVLALCAAALIVFVISLRLPPSHTHGALEMAFGDPHDTLRLTAAYLVGTGIKVANPPLRADYAAIAAVALAGLLFVPVLAEASLLVLGGYALFTVAFQFNGRWFRTLNSKDDISYGLYLYAWPIGKLIFWYVPTINVWLHVAITLVISLAAGWLSWQLIEKRFLALGHRKVVSPDRRSGLPSGNVEDRAEVSSAVAP